MTPSIVSKTASTHRKHHPHNTIVSSFLVSDFASFLGLKVIEILFTQYLAFVGVAFSPTKACPRCHPQTRQVISVLIECPIDCPRYRIIEARPSASSVKFARRIEELLSTLFTTIDAIDMMIFIFTTKRTLCPFVDDNSFFVRSKRRHKEMEGNKYKLFFLRHVERSPESIRDAVETSHNNN